MFISQVLNSAAGGQQQATWNAPSNEGFGSVVIFNQSASTLNVYLGGVGAAGTPDFSVPGGVTVTYPIKGLSTVSVGFASYPSVGTCTVSLTDEVLSAASGIIPFSVSGASSIGPNGYQQYSNGVIENWGVSASGAALSLGSGSFTFAKAYTLSALNVNATVIVDSTTDPTGIPVVTITALSLTGFSYEVGGAPPNATGRVMYSALGV